MRQLKMLGVVVSGGYEFSEESDTGFLKLTGQAMVERSEGSGIRERKQCDERQVERREGRRVRVPLGVYTQRQRIKMISEAKKMPIRSQVSE